MTRKINPMIYKRMERNYGRAESRGEKYFKKYLRSCGHNFVSRPEVREFVFKRNNYKCVECESEEHLQIDHIVSIYRVFKDGIEIEKVNSIDNLQTLCRSCNSRKRP